MPNQNESPMTIMVHFLCSSAQDSVLNVVKEKRGIVWEGWNLSFYEDLMRERKAFNEVKIHLHKLMWATAWHTL